MPSGGQPLVQRKKRQRSPESKSQSPDSKKRRCSCHESSGHDCRQELADLRSYLDERLNKIQKTVEQLLPISAPIAHPKTEADISPDDGDDATKRKSLARKLGAWVDAVEPGPPPPRSQRSWPQGTRDEDIMDCELRIKRIERMYRLEMSSATDMTVIPIVYGTDDCTSGLMARQINGITIIPPRFDDILDTVRMPLEAGKDGIKDLGCLKIISDYLEWSKLGPFKNYEGTIRSNFPVESKPFLLISSTLLQHTLLTGYILSGFVKSCSDEEFNKRHYNSFYDPKIMPIIRPKAVIGMPHRWLTAHVHEQVQDENTATGILLKIKNCELCDDDLYFPYLISEFDSDQTEQPSLDRLHFACAVALASGRPWIGDDNFMFGLAANIYEAKLYLAWSEPPVYNIARIETFYLDKKTDVERLLHMLMRVWFWGMGERRKKLEGELKVAVAEEMSRVSEESSESSGESSESSGESSEVSGEISEMSEGEDED